METKHGEITVRLLNLAKEAEETHLREDPTPGACTCDAADVDELLELAALSLARDNELLAWRRTSDRP